MSNATTPCSPSSAAGSWSARASSRTPSGRFLVRAGQFENPEGASRGRNVVIEFPSYEVALACYRSPEYAPQIALRQGAAEADIVIVEGYVGPQPG